MKDDLFKLLEEKEYFEPASPASDKAIEIAQNQLGLVFNQDYIDYLHRYGAVSFYGHIWTGISSFPGVDVVSVTKEARETNPLVSPDLYVIEEAHIDGIVVWQNSQGKIFQTIPGCKPVQICETLEEYISKI